MSWMYKQIGRILNAIHKTTRTIFSNITERRSKNILNMILANQLNSTYFYNLQKLHKI